MSSNVLDLLYGVIATPVATLRKIAEEKPIGWAIGIMAVTSVLGMLRQWDLEVLDQLQLFPNLTHTSANLLMLVFGFLFSFGVYAVMHLLGRTFGQPGSYVGLVSAQGFSSFPSILHYPLALVARVIPLPISFILSLALGIWLLVLNIIALRETYELGTGAAVLIWIGSSLAFSILLAIVGFAGIFGTLGLGL